MFTDELKGFSGIPTVCGISLCFVGSVCDYPRVISPFFPLFPPLGGQTGGGRKSKENRGGCDGASADGVR